jgi:glycosyltransferase involved in cell wall biosynthesis
MRVCLLTTGQPASNPRLVKEADTFVAAGLDVGVIGAYWSDWAAAADASLLADRAWSFTLIDWRRETAPGLFWRTRLRHRLAPAFVGWPMIDHWAVPAAISRVTPELTEAARRSPADLYVAHNLGALPAAAVAAREHGALLAFDAEDYHRGQFGPGDSPRLRRLTARVEEALLPLCDVVTAASPAIARAYARHCRVDPVPVLNVFPLAMRPEARQRAAGGRPLTLYWFSQTIGPGRGLEDVVRAMARLPGGSVELHLRGRLQSGFGAALNALARRSGLDPSCVIMHPPAPPAEMARLAARYDVGLALEPGSPDNNDLAASNKLFTYLLAGTAILATRTTGQRDVLDQIGHAARTVVPGDLDGVAEVLASWVGDRAALESARHEAWTWGGVRFNWEAERERLLEAYGGIVPPAPPAGSRVAPGELAFAGAGAGPA